MTIESGKWKIVLNNFQLSIIHFQFREGVGWEKRERFPPLRLLSFKINVYRVRQFSSYTTNIKKMVRFLNAPFLLLLFKYQLNITIISIDVDLFDIRHQWVSWVSTCTLVIECQFNKFIQVIHECFFFYAEVFN